MSTGFAVAAATAALADRLQALIGDAVPGARVTTLNPGAQALRGGEPIVNAYLFRTLRNGLASNRDLPNRDVECRPKASPTLMLDLDYMITFFGDETRLDPQRLLGLVVGGLNAEPLLSRTSIRATIAATPWLAGTGLDTQGDPLRVTPMNLPSEATARLWSEFVGAPYQLTLLYTVTPVALEAPRNVAPVPPIRRIGLDASGTAPLRILGIENALDPTLPLSGGDRVAIRLAHPEKKDLSVLLDGQPALGVTAGRDAAGRLALLLDLDAAQPGPLTAGERLVQVRRMTDHPTRVVAQSPPQRMLINPGLAGAPTYHPGTRTLSVPMALPVPDISTAALLLYPMVGTTGPARRLPVPARNRPTRLLTVSVEDMSPGGYLLSVEVDGLCSLLSYGDGRYTGPVATIAGTAA